MSQIKVDGLSVLSELTDDAILISNLLERPAIGRNKITRIICALEAYYVSVSDIERINTASHRVVESRALLPSGDRIGVTVVGTRDNQGWISEVLMTLTSDSSLSELKTIAQRA